MLFHELYEQQAAATPEAVGVICFSPTAPRVELSYRELCQSSLRLAAGLLRELDSQRQATADGRQTVTRAPIVAVYISRVHPDFLPLLLAVSRVGASFVLMSTDLREKDLEESRNALILAELKPTLLIADAADLHRFASAAGNSRNPRTVCLQDLAAPDAEWSLEDVGAKYLDSDSQTSSPPLGFLFTGGTTRTRCAAVTHEMFAHEREHYKECLHISAPAPRVLAQTSVYWGASALGQVSIALAYGGCAVFCEVRGPEELRAVVAAERADVLGCTPSELETLGERPAAELPAVRGVFTWGESLPSHLAERWRDHPRAHLRELLISTECWLSLHRSPLEADGCIGFRAVQGTQTLVLAEGGQPAKEGEVGELLLDGPMVTSGYVRLGVMGAHVVDEPEVFCAVNDRWYFRTRDLVRAGKDGHLEFRGRADLSTKVQGKWVDLLAIEESLQALPGIADVRVIPDERQMAQPHAFLVFARGADIPATLNDVRRALPADSHVHVLDHMPRHRITRKMDLKVMRELARPSPDGSWPLDPDMQGPEYLVSRAKTMVWRHGLWTLVALAVAAAWDLRALLGLVLRRRGRIGSTAAHDRVTVAGLLLLPFMHLAYLHCTAKSGMQWVERAAFHLPLNFWGIIASVVIARGAAAPGSSMRRVCNYIVYVWTTVGVGFGVLRSRSLAFPVVFWAGIGHRLQQDLQHRVHPSRWFAGPRRFLAELRDPLRPATGGASGSQLTRASEGSGSFGDRPQWASAVCCTCGCPVRVNLHRADRAAVDRAAADSPASQDEKEGAKDGRGMAHCLRCWGRLMTESLDEAASVALELLATKSGSSRGKDTLPASALSPKRSHGTAQGAAEAPPSEVPSPPVAAAAPGLQEEEPCEWWVSRMEGQDVVDLPLPPASQPEAGASAPPDSNTPPEFRRLLVAVANEAGGAGRGQLGAEASLQWLDSLRVARLAARLRLEMGAPDLTTAAVRRSATVAELLQAVQAAQQRPQQQEDQGVAAVPESASREYAVHYSPGQHFPMGAWVVRSDKPLDIPRVQEAVRLLVERHGALRARPVDPLKLLSFCLDTGILFTIVARLLDRGPLLVRLLRRGLSCALRRAWPRVRVPPRGSARQMQVEVITVGDQRAMELALRGRREVQGRSGAALDVCLARLRAQVAGLWVFGPGAGGDIAVLPPPPSHRDAPLLYVDRRRREAGLLVGPGRTGWVPPPYGFSAVLCARLAPNASVAWLRLSAPGELVVMWKADDAPQTRWERHVAHLVPCGRYAPTDFDYLCVQAYHSFADGHSFEPIVGDLLEIYGALEPASNRRRRPLPPPLAIEAFAELERRLFAALDATELSARPQLTSLRGSLTTIKFRGRGYNHTVGVQRGAVDALHRAAFRYGVPLDVLLLALTAIGIARASKKESVDLTLYVPMRDGPGEAGLVGLFADWRVLTIHTAFATSTVLGVALEVAQALRLRRWTVFNALAKAESTMVNFQRLDTTPPANRAGCVQVGEELWRLGEQQKGIRIGKSDQLEWVLQPLSVTIDQQDEETWWVILTCAVSWYPHSWARRFVQGFEDALQGLLLAPTQRVHREAPEEPWRASNR